MIDIDVNVYKEKKTYFVSVQTVLSLRSHCFNNIYWDMIGY